MVSDGEDLSSSDLVRRIGAAVINRVMLPPVPVSILSMVGGLMDRQAEIEHRYASLAVDISSTQERLGWAPLVTVGESLKRTVRWCLADGRSRAR